MMQASKIPPLKTIIRRTPYTMKSKSVGITNNRASSKNNKMLTENEYCLKTNQTVIFSLLAFSPVSTVRIKGIIRIDHYIKSS